MEAPMALLVLTAATLSSKQQPGYDVPCQDEDTEPQPVK